ncbi:hypothetical protein Trisim1_004006 [Trichoderma cf. simile WF8]
MRSLYEESVEYMNSFDRNNRLEDINKAIEKIDLATKEAGTYVPPDMLISFGTLLFRRSRKLDSIVDATQGIEITSSAISSMTLDDPIYGDALASLQSLFLQRSELTNSEADLDQAIDIAEDLLNGPYSNRYMDRATVLRTLGHALMAKHKQTGSMSVAKRGLNALRDVINSLPRDSPYRAKYLYSLSCSLGPYSQHTGSVDDLNEGINAISEAVDMTPHDDSTYTSMLLQLTTMLKGRFDQQDSLDSLNRGINLTQQFLDENPSHEDRVPFLSGLCLMLSSRSFRTKSIDDVNLAVKTASDALDGTPYDDEQYSARSGNLGRCLQQRFSMTGSLEDLERAIDLYEKTVDTTTVDTRSAYMRELCRTYRLRFDETGSLEDIDQAISLWSKTLDATPPEHQFRMGILLEYADDVLSRFLKQRSMKDSQLHLDLSLEVWFCSFAKPHERINAAMAAYTNFITQFRWHEGYQLLKDAVLLLHKINPRSMKRDDAQAALRDKVGLNLASRAAAVTLQVGGCAEEALQLLEVGRGIISSSLMDMRWEITDLKLMYPDLADEFILLRDQLDTTPESNTSALLDDNMTSIEMQQKQRRDTDSRFNEIIETIRTKPEFSGFLLPSTVEELKKAAEHGPIVVINEANIRDDAFIIQTDSISIVDLSHLDPSEKESQLSNLNSRSNLISLLEWLWRQVCRPILDALNFKSPVENNEWPHIWWVPTGIFSQMPLHAAGIYSQASKETVMDRVISSYAPSIKALIHGRKISAQNATKPSSTESCALMVAMEKTPGLSNEGSLFYANREVEMLEQLCPQLQLTPIKPPRHKKDVITQISTCKIFHFAGHGRVDQKEPSQSCILLEDWKSSPLTVGEIRDCSPQDNAPFLAYLSACSTGVNSEERLLDEAVNLINGFQLAGFQHVVGTLWEVSDKHCVDVAKILYETLQDEGMTDVAVSRGLHKALRSLREGEMDDVNVRDAELVDSDDDSTVSDLDFLWVPYVHFGI